MPFDMQIVQLGTLSMRLGEVLFASVGIIVLLLALITLALWRSAGARKLAAIDMARQAAATESRMAEIVRVQAEMQGRMGTLAEIFGTRQADLNRAIGDRLDGMSARLGHSIREQTRNTHENLSRLQERLAVIDQAQGNLRSLADQVVELQSILSNKQTRGAFGQARMEAIITDGMPPGAYAFQHKLSNERMPDCIVHMPNGLPPLVIDAKFPLESWNAIRSAREQGEEAARQAAQNFRRDIEVHIKAISERYLIAGETHETAFMFVPSESIFADIHEKFEALVQRAHRARVVIVSPSLLMLSIQVIQAVMKDARMREQAHLIQGEVLRLMEDVSRLDDRVRKLQAHFLQTGKDIDLILTSTQKIARRGERIEAMDFSAESGRVSGKVASDTTDGAEEPDAADRPDEDLPDYSAAVKRVASAP